ncbi:hypothetical protein Tco_1167346 [Tanacetum coccineum]
MEYPLRPPFFTLNLIKAAATETKLGDESDQWFNELRAMEAEITNHHLLAHSNANLLHQSQSPANSNYLNYNNREACSDSAELESCRAEKAAPMLNFVPQQVKQKDCKPADRENDGNVNRSRKCSNECRFPGEKMDQHARGDNNKNSRPLKKRAEEVNDADNKSSKDENPTSR